MESLARTELAGQAAAAGDSAGADLQFSAALELASQAGSDFATWQALTRCLQAYALNADARAVVALAPAVRAAALRAGRPAASVEVALGNVHQLTGDYEAAEAAYAMRLRTTPKHCSDMRTLAPARRGPLSISS